MHECWHNTPGQSFALLHSRRSADHIPGRRVNQVAEYIDSVHAGEPPRWLLLPDNQEALALGCYRQLHRRLVGWAEGHRTRRRAPGQEWPPRSGGYWAPFPFRWAELTDKAAQDPYWAKPLTEARTWPLLVILGAAPSPQLDKLLKARLNRWTIITASRDDLDSISDFYERSRTP